MLCVSVVTVSACTARSILEYIIQSATETYDIEYRVTLSTAIKISSRTLSACTRPVNFHVRHSYIFSISS